MVKGTANRHASQQPGRIPLPVFALCRSAYRLTFRHLGDLLLLSWLPAVVFIAVLMLPVPGGFEWGWLGKLFVAAFIWVPLVSGWLRRMMLGQTERVWWKPARLRRIEFYVFCLCLFVAFVIAVLVIAGMYIPYAEPVVGLLCLWAVSRSTLMFPAFALQVPETGSVIFEATQGYVPAIALMLILNIGGLALLTGLPVFLIDFYGLDLPVPEFAQKLAVLIWLTAGLVAVLATTMTLVCLMYQRFKPRIEWLEEGLMYDYSGK